MKKFAIITGGGTGIGRALAIKLAQRKIYVLIAGRRLQPLQETQAFMPKYIQIISADVASETDQKKILPLIAEKGQVDYLVHNAATVDPVIPLEKIPVEAWEHTFAINLHAPLFLTQKLIPYLKNGRVLNISSGLAHLPLYSCGAYCTTKAALYMLYLMFKTELTTKNIYCGSVMPGIVETPIQDYMRSMDSTDFPGQDLFKKLKAEEKLIPATTCADFLTWLLCETTNDQYIEKEWDIYDASHHKHWLGANKLPYPDFG